MINVMILDSHILFRECLVCLLEKNNLIKNIYEATDLLEARDILETFNIDIVILDITVECDGLKLIDYVKTSKVNTKLLVLSSLRDNDTIVKINDLDIDGFILKSTNSNEFFNAIDGILSGKKYIQSELIPIINNYLIKKDMDSEKINLLTTRELQILKMISHGGKNIEIANKMNISERTVKNHLSHIFEKIEVKDRTQAAVFAIRNNIIEL